MTYLELYENTTRQLEKSEITLGEYEEMIKPLDREIIITCKDCKHFYCIAECPSIKVCGLHNGAMRISEKFYCADAEMKKKERDTEW